MVRRRNTQRKPARGKHDERTRPRALRGRLLSHPLAAEALEDRRLLALSTTDLSTGLTPTELAQSLVGAGLTISNVSYTGSNISAGQFTGGVSEGLNIESGVMLSSGNIADAAGPNESESTSTSLDLPGDPDLDGLIPGFSTNDATVLEFDFDAAGGTFTFEYVFGSEEYNEFVNSSFNDVFGFFLDGENIALVPGTMTPVSINNVNAGLNGELYNNNSPFDLGTPTPFLTEADGFTVVLQATATIEPGTHHIKLAIADAGDTILDSWVFLAAESFVSGDSDMSITKSTSPDPPVIHNPLTYTLEATNNGPDPANGVTVVDVLPPGVTFVSATTSQGSIEFEGGIVSAELGNMNAGATATVSIVVVPTELGSITNTATVEALQPDPDPSNNSFSLTSVVELPSLAIDDVQVIEGHTGTRDAVFTVSLNGFVPDADVTVDYAAGAVTATGADFIFSSGSLLIPAGELSRTVTVGVIGDKLDEPTETFVVELQNPVNALIRKPTGVGTIIDDDLPPALYVSDVQVSSTFTEPLTTMFTVALDVPSGQTVSVQYETVAHTAVEGADYEPVSGVLEFPPGVTTLHVPVQVWTSGAYRANEMFHLRLSNPNGAAIADAIGIATNIHATSPPAATVIDDGDPGYARTPGWANVTNLDGYYLDHDYRPPGDGSGTASWTFGSLLAGPYQVFTRWVPFTNRATNASYTVYNGATLQGTVTVNQQMAPTGDTADGIAWYPLGTFDVSTGVLRVELSDDANGYVVADAVRLVRGTDLPRSPEIDVSSVGRSIDDGESFVSIQAGTNFGSLPVASTSAIRTFSIHNHGNADLHLNGSPRARVFGLHDQDFWIVSQPDATLAPGGTTYFDVGFRPSAAGGREARVAITSDDADESFYDFAVIGIGGLPAPMSFSIDDGDAGFGQSGAWATKIGSGVDNDTRSSAPGTGGDTATWTFMGLESGHYDVYASWVADPNNASDAPYSVSTGFDTPLETNADQRQAPTGPEGTLLGTVNVTNGLLSVTLADSANGIVVADSITIKRSVVPTAGPLVHNIAFPQDVNGDSRVSPVDALVVINALLAKDAQAEASFDGPPSASPAVAGASGRTYYIDVNADGRVSPLDALLVINYLIDPTSAGSSHADDGGTVAPASKSAPSALASPAIAAIAVDRAMAAEQEPADLLDGPATDSAMVADVASTSQVDGQAEPALLIAAAVDVSDAGDADDEDADDAWASALEA